MPRVLSQDIRERVVAAVDVGMLCRAVAGQFGVSAARAIRWRQLVVQNGTPATKPQGGGRRAVRIPFENELSDASCVKRRALLENAG